MNLVPLRYKINFELNICLALSELSGWVGSCEDLVMCIFVVIKTADKMEGTKY